MLLSTQTGVTDRAFGEAESYRIIAEAGFKGIDFLLSEKAIPWNESFFADVNSKEFKEFFTKKRELAGAYGFKIVQTHAPYRRPFQFDKEGYEMVLGQCERAIYATALLESPYIVAHPVTHPDFNNGQNHEKGVDANVRFFSKLVPSLKETGVKICIENLYVGEVESAKTPNICSDGESLAEVIDVLNATHGECFAACLDTGHALISGNDPTKVLKALGKRVATLHIHDSYGTFDDHLSPGYGIIDWKAFLKALGEIGYEGAFNFEADNYYYNFLKPYFDKTVMQDAMKLLYTTGVSMINTAKSK